MTVTSTDTGDISTGATTYSLKTGVGDQTAFTINASTGAVTLTGVVTKVEWTNPHVWFWINVKDEATGKLVNWGCEMGSPNALQRTGWTIATMKEGMIVSLTGSRAKDGSNKVNTAAVTVDGKRLGAASSAGPAQ